MTDQDNIIEKANTLMRRRVFVAGGARPQEPQSAAAEPPAAAEQDDLPVLTEVFVEPGPEPVEPTIPQEMIEARAAELAEARAVELAEARAAELLQSQLPFQRQALADELAAWLDTELPQVVMHVLDGVTDQIIGQVAEAARAALLRKLQEALEAESISLDEEA